MGKTRQSYMKNNKPPTRWEKFCGMFYKGGVEEYRQRKAVSEDIKCLSGIYEPGTRKIRKF